MKNPVIVTGALMLALTVARPFAAQPAPTRLALELQDYAALPIIADNTNTNMRAQLARVTILRDEPGVRRFDSFARAVAFAMSRPEEVNINEILFRPTRQEL
jgi:hypothetical protein